MDAEQPGLIRIPAVVAKVCTRCGRLKPLSHFSRLAAARDGLNYMCKPCGSERTLQWIRDNPDRAVRPGYRRHRLSDEKFGGQLAAQGDCCAICARPPGDGQRLAVDHDHACCPGEWSCGNCVRGLLCAGCNRAVGILGGSPGSARALATYLRRSSVGGPERTP